MRPFIPVAMLALGLSTLVSAGNIARSDDKEWEGCNA
jgi:hypothetical protein